MRVFLLSIFILILSAAITYAQPKIIFDEETHDFGTIGKGDSIEYIFEFTNKGNEDLDIKEIVPS
jgi:hypothetical protein